MTLLRMKDKDTTKPFPCENCDSEDEAVSRCNDCCVFMCDFCVTAHKRVRATRGHQILSMAEVQKLGSKALAKPSFCVKHMGETLKLFCETCEETICRDCTIVDHREHEYKFVADVAEREREILHIFLSKAKGKEVVVSNGLETVYAMKELVPSRVSEVNNEVDEFFDEQVKALEYQRASLKREVMTEGKVRGDRLEKQSRVLSSFLAQLKSGVEFTSQALDDGDNVQLLTMKNQLSQRLTQLSSTKIDCKPCQNEYFKLRVRQTIWRDMKELATVCFIINPQMFSVSIVGGEEGVMYRTLVGQTVSLVVTNKDREERGEYHVAASVAMTGEDEESLPTFGNNNGSHTFCFCPGGLQAMYGSRPYERGTTHGNCFKDGRYCWTLRVGDFASYHRRFEIGVTTGIKCKGGIQTWSLSVNGDRFQRAIRSDRVLSKGMNIEHDDVFTVFLNLETETLSIYHDRSQTTEVFKGVKGPLRAITAGVHIF